VSATLERGLRESGLEALSGKALGQFNEYLALLLKWNARLNLTAVREPDSIVRRHFIECIACAQALPDGQSLLDFGSGAGLPGIPISICRPDLRVTLAESQRKKAAFLRECVRSLELEADVFDGRVEEMPEERQFSIVTLRAVDRMEEACLAAFPRLTLGGWMVLFATVGTQTRLISLLPDIEWERTLPLPGLEKGQLLLGKRRS
jgi:16S rRNA (guanine527-N7)-methyltransferase